MGGDFVSLEEPLPCELLGSSPLVAFFSNSLDFSLSFSGCSLTPSLDFFLTMPAASKAVVALCMILTLPDLFLPSRRAFVSFSFRLPDGVPG